MALGKTETGVFVVDIVVVCFFIYSKCLTCHPHSQSAKGTQMALRKTEAVFLLLVFFGCCCFIAYLCVFRLDSKS